MKSQGEGFVVDEESVKADARFDGKWVLRTNTDYEPAEVALTYKQLWRVEDLFRSMKSPLATRPLYHRRDETIRGHVFCSFLALVLRQALEDRLAAKGCTGIEWAQMVRNLDRLEEVELEKDGKRFVLRTEAPGSAARSCRPSAWPWARRRARWGDGGGDRSKLLPWCQGRIVCV